MNPTKNERSTYKEGLTLGKKSHLNAANRKHLIDYDLISKHNYGEKFEGNACRRLLKWTDNLNDKEILQDTLILKIVPFIQTLKTLNKLVDASFKSKRLDAKCGLCG